MATVRSWISMTCSLSQAALSVWHCMQAFMSFLSGLMTRWSLTLNTPCLGVGHVAVRAGGPGLPVHALVGEQLELRVADEGHLEPGDGLLPLLVGLVAAQLLDDVLDGDVPPLAAVLPGEVQPHGLHVLVLGDAVGHVALGAHGRALLLAGQLLLVHPMSLSALPRVKPREIFSPMSLLSWQSMQATPRFLFFSGILEITSM